MSSGLPSSNHHSQRGPKYLICFPIIQINLDLPVFLNISHKMHPKQYALLKNLKSKRKQSWENTVAKVSNIFLSETVSAAHKEALLPCFSCHKHSLSCSFTMTAWPLALLSSFPPFIEKATCGHSPHSGCLSLRQMSTN